MLDITELLSEAIRLDASDLHIIAGVPPMFRVSKRLAPLPNTRPLTQEESLRIIESTLSPDNKALFHQNKDIDYSISIPQGRFRVNAYFQLGTAAAAFRQIPNKILTPEDLRLPPVCFELTKLKQGFIVVTGPTGHGKSTTIASMINLINMTRTEHIITIEDPIEYVFPKGLSILSQREIRFDTLSWRSALRSVLREDPNIVFVGEMRDFETIQAAITIAETGHLVFSTLHTNSAAQTIDRIIDVFPEHQQNQVRIQLSFVLEAILSERLLPSVSGGVVPLFEVLTATPAVRATIREGKTQLIDNIIQTSRQDGMVPLETALADAVREGIITIETALQYALHPHELSKLIR